MLCFTYTVCEHIFVAVKFLNRMLELTHFEHMEQMLTRFLSFVHFLGAFCFNSPG